jgi:uncharacterized protein YciI
MDGAGTASCRCASYLTFEVALAFLSAAAGTQLAICNSVGSGPLTVRERWLHRVRHLTPHLRMYIVILHYKLPLAEIDSLMTRHVAWLKRHYRDGLFIASGRQVPRTGGVILARSGDVSALEAALAQDPFVLHGAADYDLIEFKPSMTAAGAEVLKSL